MEMPSPGRAHDRQKKKCQKMTTEDLKSSAWDQGMNPYLKEQNTVAPESKSLGKETPGERRPDEGMIRNSIGPLVCHFK